MCACVCKAAKTLLSQKPKQHKRKVLQHKHCGRAGQGVGGYWGHLHAGQMVFSSYIIAAWTTSIKFIRLFSQETVIRRFQNKTTSVSYVIGDKQFCFNVAVLFN